MITLKSALVCQEKVDTCQQVYSLPFSYNAMRLTRGATAVVCSRVLSRCRPRPSRQMRRQKKQESGGCERQPRPAFRERAGGREVNHVERQQASYCYAPAEALLPPRQDHSNRDPDREEQNAEPLVRPGGVEAFTHDEGQHQANAGDTPDPCGPSQRQNPSLVSVSPAFHAHLLAVKEEVTRGRPNVRLSAAADRVRRRLHALVRWYRQDSDHGIPQPSYRTTGYRRIGHG